MRPATGPVTVAISLLDVEFGPDLDPIVAGGADGVCDPFGACTGHSVEDHAATER